MEILVKATAKAEKMPGHLDNSIKKDRARRLIEVSKELEIEYMNKFVGKKVEMLTENDKDGFTIGHTSNFLLVKLNKKTDSDKFINVKLNKVEYPYILGEVDE